MKTWHVFIIFGAGLLLVAVILPALARAKQYSGPGIHGNLIALEVAKARWIDAHKGGDEWPTLREVSPYLTNVTSGATFGQIRPRDREIYIINRIDAPVYAYDPPTERLFSVSSNELQLIKDMK